MRIPQETPSRIPPGMWRVILRGIPLTRSARIFATGVLAPMMARSGRIRPAGAADLIARYALERGRDGYTRRRIRQLLAELIRAGVLARDLLPAPGRHASYRALLPGTDFPRPMTLRPRGVIGPRIHAQFARELAEERGPP